MSKIVKGQNQQRNLHLYASKYTKSSPKHTHTHNIGGLDLIVKKQFTNEELKGLTYTCKGT